MVGAAAVRALLVWRVGIFMRVRLAYQSLQQIGKTRSQGSSLGKSQLTSRLGDRARHSTLAEDALIARTGRSVWPAIALTIIGYTLVWQVANLGRLA
jgi:hypothetical protein